MNHPQPARIYLNLYKVLNEYQDAHNYLLDMDDEIPAEVIADTMEGLSGDVEIKTLNAAAYYKNVQAEIGAMKEYEASMRMRRKKLQNYNEKLKDYIKKALEICDIKQVKGDEFTISIRKSPPKVIIDSDIALEQKYIARIEIYADKTKIKEDIKNNIEVKGAHLESGTSLVIR